jgi:hypothetical protein
MGGSPDRHELPDGVLTFLLTDIEGSTPLWERHRAAMGVALALQRELDARSLRGRGGPPAGWGCAGWRPARRTAPRPRGASGARLHPLGWPAGQPE